MRGTVEVRARIEQHQPGLPWFVSLPEDALSGLGRLEGTVTVEGTINGVDLGRRGLKRWGPDRRQTWFLEVPKPVWTRAGLEVGDSVRLRLRRASEDNPAELEQLLAASRAARERWDKLTPGQKRRLREDILAVKSSDARMRRARKALL